MDRSLTIRSSVQDVQLTLVIAALLVVDAGLIALGLRQFYRKAIS